MPNKEQKREGCPFKKGDIVRLKPQSRERTFVVHHRQPMLFARDFSGDSHDFPMLSYDYKGNLMNCSAGKIEDLEIYVPDEPDINYAKLKLISLYLSGRITKKKLREELIFAAVETGMEMIDYVGGINGQKS